MEQKTVKLFKISSPNEKNGNDENGNQESYYGFRETTENPEDTNGGLHEATWCSHCITNFLVETQSTINVNGESKIVTREELDDFKKCNSCRVENLTFYKLGDLKKDVGLCSTCLADLLVAKGYNINLVPETKFIGVIQLDSGLILVGDPHELLFDENSEIFGKDIEEFYDKVFTENIPKITQFNNWQGIPGIAIAAPFDIFDGVFPVYAGMIIDVIISITIKFDNNLKKLKS